MQWNISRHVHISRRYFVKKQDTGGFPVPANRIGENIPSVLLASIKAGLQGKVSGIPLMVNRKVAEATA